MRLHRLEPQREGDGAPGPSCFRGAFTSQLHRSGDDLSRQCPGGPSTNPFCSAAGKLSTRPGGGGQDISPGLRVSAVRLPHSEGCSYTANMPPEIGERPFAREAQPLESVPTRSPPSRTTTPLPRPDCFLASYGAIAEVLPAGDSTHVARGRDCWQWQHRMTAAMGMSPVASARCPR